MRERVVATIFVLFAALGPSEARADTLKFSFWDPDEDAWGCSSAGCNIPFANITGPVSDLINMTFTFNNSTGDYEVTLTASALKPFIGAVRVNVNLYNATRAQLFLDNQNDFFLNAATTTLVVTGNSPQLLAWEAFDRVAACEGPGGITPENCLGALGAPTAFSAGIVNYVTFPSPLSAIDTFRTAPAATIVFVRDFYPLGDFDGDGVTDRTVYRPSTTIWYTLRSGGWTASQWGTSNDRDVAADFDGDGRSDIAVWRPSTGTWYIKQSGDGQLRAVVWGVAGDVPLAADVDGDGKADPIVWRPSTGVWYVLQSAGNIRVLLWGNSSDQPFAHDWNGDGRADFVVWRPLTGAWYVHYSSGGSTALTWGSEQLGDVPLAADYDGDGRTDAGIFRTTTGTWYVLNSSGGASIVSFGSNGDYPVAGDWDGDGRTDIAVWRPSTGVWYVVRSSNGDFVFIEWGQTGDMPFGRRPGQ